MAYDRVANGDDVTADEFNKLYDGMEKLEAITATASTLAPGSSATAAVQTDGGGNKNLALGLPQGATGAPGANGKSLNYLGEWSAATAYVNSPIRQDIVKKDGSVYICVSNNQGASPPNTLYWQLLVAKGDASEGAGNLKGLNVTTVETGKPYAIQPVTIPSAGGTLEGNLVEVAATSDMDRKLEKNFDGFYGEKTELVDGDLFVLQDSESTATPKANRKVKASTIKKIEVDNAKNVTATIDDKPITDIFETNGTTAKKSTLADFAAAAPDKGNQTEQDATTDAGKSFVFGNTNGFGTEDNTGYFKLWSIETAPNVFGCSLVPSRDNQQLLGLSGNRFKNVWLTTQPQSDNSDRAATTKYVKEAIANFYGSAVLGVSPSLSASTNTIKRQGNLVFIDFYSTALANSSMSYTFTIPNFCTAGNTALTLRPSSTRQVLVWVLERQIMAPYNETNIGAVATVGTNGIISFSYAVSGYTASKEIRIIAGYEL